MTTDPLEDPEDAENGRDLRHHPSAGDLRYRREPRLEVNRPQASRPRGVRLGPEGEAEVVRLYTEEGMSGTRLARRFNRSDTNIYFILRKHGVKGRAAGRMQRVKIPEADVHSVAWRYLEDREPILSIMKTYNCSTAAVYKFMNRWEIRRRDERLSEFAKRAEHPRGARMTRSPHMNRRFEEQDAHASRAREADLADREASLANREAALREALKKQPVAEAVMPLARSGKLTEEYYGLKPVQVERRVIPTVPDATKVQASTRNGQTRAPLRLRFPPLPGEPGYVMKSKKAA